MQKKLGDSDRTEKWNVYHSACYDAIAWPYAKGWEEFMRAPEPLMYAEDFFGCVSPNDGFGEMGSVPAHLPRKLTRGQYRMAVYHDAEHVYCFIEGRFAKPVHRLAAPDAFRYVIAFLAPDSTWYWQCYIDQDGATRATSVPNIGGSRLRAVRRDEIEWEDLAPGRRLARIAHKVANSVRYVRSPRGALASWRLARKDLAPLLKGSELRFSAMIEHDASIEQAAWGASTTWHLRPDEAGTVRLVAAREQPPWPVVKRADLDYSPRTEGGTLTLTCDGLYGDDETMGFNEVYGHDYFKSTEEEYKQQCLVVVNGAEKLLPLKKTVKLDVSLRDGENHFKIRTIGSPPCVFSIIKRSGNRIADLPYGPEAAWDEDRIDRLIKEGFKNFKAWQDKRLAAGGRDTLAVVHAASAAAALGFIWLCRGGSDEYLERLNREAEFTLKFQHADGTVRCYHLDSSNACPRPWAGGAYDTGRIGELWLAAYAALGDKKYLDASRRLVKAFETYRIEYNHNYAAFGMWHLAEHYRLTRDRAALNHLLYYAKHCAGTLITPCGFQAGHNFYTCYGDITLKALALCCSLLPEDEPFRPVLRELCVRMTNQVISRAQPDGLMSGMNRMHIGQKALVMTPCLVAFLVQKEEARRLDRTISAMAALAYPDVGCLGELCKYAAHRKALLAGKRVDPFRLYPHLHPSVVGNKPEQRH